MAAPSFRSKDLQSNDLSKPEYEKKLDPRYECPVCTLVLNKPMQLSCGHHVCEKCLNKVFEKGDKATCPINDDESCRDLSRNEVFPDVSVGREILNLKVYCTNKEHGCNHVDTVRQIPEHEVNCPHKLDTARQQRRNLPQHPDCSKKTAECAFKYFGCKQMGSELELKEHMIKDVIQHLELMAIYISERDKNPLVAQHASVVNVTDDLKAGISSVENGIKELKLKIDGLTEKATTMERQLADLPSKTVFEQQARDTVDIEERVAALVEQSDTFTHHLHGNTEISVTGMNRQTRLLEQGNHNDALIRNYDVRIAEMDLRFQILETASYNGVLIWKIKDYMRRKQDAVNGRTLSLYSQPFYTSKYGYKMCVRTYLNGDSVGRNTHVSLFFVVMGGEFDALLPWPFQQKVTLYIMDQGPGKRHLSDHFHPDARSTSFRRPVSEMNVASGCPLFVSHTVLESNSNQYLKDDTLFIRCNVDLNGLDNF